MTKTNIFLLFLTISIAGATTLSRTTSTPTKATLVPLQVSLSASAILLYPPSASVQLYCTVQNYNKYTAIIYTISDTVIYDSTTGYQAPSVSVLALNRIEYRNVTLGLLDVFCTANKTSSNSLTIPYMKKLVYSNQPINPYLGDTFEPHCDVELAPIPNKYSILFQKDGNITGNWTADGSLMIWSRPSKLPDLMVTSGSSLYPTFTARQVASSTSVDGVYSCSLQYSEYNFIYRVSAGGFRVNFLKEGTSTALAPTLPPMKYSANLTVFPATLQVGHPNTLTCYVVIPREVNYNVTFYYNFQAVGYYEKERENEVVWYAPAVVSFFTLTSSVWTYPFYSVVMVPINRQAQGYYQCSVSFRDPVNNQIIVERHSSTWNMQNSAFSLLLSSNFMVFALLLSLTCKSVLL